MAYTQVPLWATGYVVTATDSETYLRNNMAALLAYRGSVLLTRAAVLSVADGAATTVPFTIETHDTDGYHEGVTNPSRITIPAGRDGYYRIFASVQWAGNAAGARYLYILKNVGATVLAVVQAAVTAIPLTQVCVVTALLSVGDYVYVSVLQNSGGALDIQQVAGTPLFGADL